MAQPHPGVATIRTPRTIALEKGTRREGFKDGVDYCSKCGHPLSAALPHSHYVEQEVRPTPGGVDYQQKHFK